jgi:hypothetical protein
LKINGLGYGEKYKYVHAGLKIYGYPDLPNEVYIEEVNIENMPVHGAIIMGDEIRIDRLTVSHYGTKDGRYLAKLSNVKSMPEDAYGVWLQKNTHSKYRKIVIRSGDKKSVLLGPGNISKPTVIDTLQLQINKDWDYHIDDDELTNIVVRHLKIDKTGE